MNTRALSTVLAATATFAVMGALAPQAFAGSLVPQKETEINVGLGCLDPDPDKCIDKDEYALELPWIKDITSLVDETTRTKSRLFVDTLDTANEYTDGSALVKFKAGDAGTNPEGFWFRPSEVDEGGQGEEKGQLEVGTFEFEFTKTIAELTLDFLDVERHNSTQILAINGIDYDGPALPKLPDDEISSLVFNDVFSITLKLGQDEEGTTGDGVDFRLSKEEGVSVPEPASVLGLMVVGALGAAKSLRRKQS